MKEQTIDIIESLGAHIWQKIADKALCPGHSQVHWQIQGGHQGRTPPRGPNSFIFMQFSGKNKLAHPLWELAPSPLGKSWIRH